MAGHDPQPGALAPSILVVDDEPALCQLVKRVLERRGYHVTACTTAVDALAVDGPIDLLLVDFILPETNGRALTLTLRERWPRLPVVLMSGYLYDEELMPPPPSRFIQKPMVPDVIVRAVEEALKEDRVPRG